MQVAILSVFLLLSSSLLFSAVVCDPNHHHDHHNDFPWQNILSSLGIVFENQSSVISITEPSGDATVGSKEHYTSESTVEILKSETKDGIETPVIAQNESTVGILKSERKDEIETPVVAQNGTTIEVPWSSGRELGLGYKVIIPIVSILFFICFWYCVWKCCCICFEACCCGCIEEDTPVVVMQSNTVQTQQSAPAAPQIILQQPIIQEQAPPMYDAQKWAQPPPQGPPQWSQPPQGPPQWAPHPMGQQQQYSPHSSYDNVGFYPDTAPPPYDTRRY